MQICKLQKNNLSQAIDLVQKVFDEFEAPEYSKMGIETFRHFIGYDNLCGMMQRKEMTFYGCFLESTLIGVGALRGNQHISLLFVQKEYHRQGVARRLFRNMLLQCQNSNPDQKAMTVNASPYGVIAYEHLGFQKISEEQLRDGIRFTPMIYKY